MSNVDLLSPRDRDLFLAKLFLPLLVVVLGAFYNWIFPPIGYSSDADVFAPIAYAVLSGFLAARYLKMVGRPIKRDGKSMLTALGGLIPYVFAIYVMGYFGVYSIYRDFSFHGVVYGIIFLLIGYRFLYVFWMLTEIGRKSDEIQKKIATT